MARQHSNTVRTLRWAIAAFGLAAGVALLASGNTLVGVVLLGMGGLRLAMLVSMRRQHRSFGGGPPGGRGPMRDAMQRLARGEVAVAASTIGVDADELRLAMADGRSIATIASTNGVPTERVVDAVVRDASAKIDHAVSAGNLAPERAEMLRGRLDRWANRFVAGSGPTRSDSLDAERLDMDVVDLWVRSAVPRHARRGQ